MKKARIVVIGGGWAGCAAALSARKAGAEVVLLERTDLLLGTGLVGGIMYNNGRLSAAAEARALGAGELFGLIDAVVRHTNVAFPGHAHASLYDVNKIEPLVRSFLMDQGIEIKLEHRAIEVEKEGDRLQAVVVERRETIAGDAFVEATGTAGPVGNCLRFDNSCVMCILRCPTFGPRVSIAARAGVNEVTDHFFAALSGSCKLRKASLASWLVEKLEREGVVMIPVPRYLIDPEIIHKKACQQYALREFAENLILLDTGSVKLMAPFFPLERLRQVSGFAHAEFEDPYSGGRGNSVRYSLITPHDQALRVQGVENLFCAGEKCGLVVGHTEAICTGSLAGHNAVRLALGREPLILPPNLILGDFLAFVGEALQTAKGKEAKYTFAGGVYFDRMRALGLYTTDTSKIERRVEAAGLQGILARKL